MTKLMLSGAYHKERPVPADVPSHGRLRAGGWTGLTLTVPADLDLDSADGAADMAQAQHHLLCRYIVQGDVLPVAFGSFFSSPTAVKHHLLEHAALLSELAQRLDGMVEFTVKLLEERNPQSSRQPSATGVEHLRHRRFMRDASRRRGRDIRQVLNHLQEGIDQIAVAQKPRSCGRTIDILLPRHRLSTCLQRLNPIASLATSQGVSLSLTGPYPAFSFVARETELV